MAIHRTQHNKNNPYVMLNKGFLDDPNLSAKAKGILAYLLSRPDGWVTRTEQIASVMKDGLESIKSGLRELEGNGYFKRFAVRDDKGKITHWVKDVFETPQPVLSPQTENPLVANPVDGKPSDGTPANGLPLDGNRTPIVNKDVSTTDSITNDHLPPTPTGEPEEEGVFDCLDEPSPTHNTGSTHNSSSESKHIDGARDNNTTKQQDNQCNRAKRSTNLNDPFSQGAAKAVLKQLTKQVQLTAPKRNFFLDNCWGHLAIAHGLDPEAVWKLLEQWIVYKVKSDKSMKIQKPVDYAQSIIRSWDKTEGLQNASSYWTEFVRLIEQGGMDAVDAVINRKAAATQSHYTPTQSEQLTPDEQAWLAIASEVSRSNDRGAEVWVKCDGGIWGCNSNMSWWNGKIKDLAKKIPLHTLPTELHELGYAECLRRAKEKPENSHLHFPAPLPD